MSSTESDLARKQRLLRDQYEAAQAFNRFHIRQLKKLKDEVIERQLELAARKRKPEADAECRRTNEEISPAGSDNYRMWSRTGLASGPAHYTNTSLRGSYAGSLTEETDILAQRRTAALRDHRLVANRSQASHGQITGYGQPFL